jgi:hypothetical protein
MLIAGSVDLGDALRALAVARPIFHSEADFQHALAWQVHAADPLMSVRLETRAAQGERLDLWFRRPDLGLSTALELKYLCASLDAVVAGERFVLPAQGAQDIRGYDVMKDIARVERIVAGAVTDKGAVVTVTNDASYWTRPSHGRTTGAAAFRLYEGEHVGGRRAWGPESAGTQRYRQDAIELSGDYVMAWHDYSVVTDQRGGRFRQLIIEIR